MFGNITNLQLFVFGNTENGYFWRYQNTDNQYRYNYKNNPNSTGKELDTETGYSYFGARYLDHELLTSWLSVDPMADKYPSISPYAYCVWSPIMLIDPEGKENVIYVVDLQGNNKRVDVEKAIKEANNRFEELGLETRVMLAPDGKDFNPNYMDKTDSYAVIGSVEDVKDFIKNNSSYQSKKYNDWYGGTNNPEKSVNLVTRKASVIAMDANALPSAANRLHTETETMCAFLILHGAGHNAGLNHSNELPRDMNQNSNNAAIMMGGDAISWFNSRNMNTIMNRKNNSFYVDKMKQMFGTKKAQNNYVYNKAKSLHPSIVF